MTYRINRAETISIANGPSLSIADYIDVEAYDRISAVVPKNSVATEVQIQPGIVGDVTFLAITAERYTDLTFIIDESVTTITLDGPLVLMNLGLIALLIEAINTMTFTNADTEEDNEVVIFVGRTVIES